MDYTIFYAWQSDKDRDLNRFLIRDALKDAIDRIAKDASIEESPRLDHDTKDLPGMPDIANAIFRKIETCGIFLADLTLISEIPAQGEEKLPKGLPNPNVLLELGYAAASIGWERIIAVMNVAHGGPGILPFDLTHRRWPITYTAPAGLTDTKPARKKLSEDIEVALRTAVKAGVVNKTPSTPEVRIATLEQMLQSTLDGQVAMQESIREMAETVKVVVTTSAANKPVPVHPEEAYRKSLLSDLAKGVPEKFTHDAGFLLLTIVPQKMAAPRIDIAQKASRLPLGMQPIEASGWDHHMTARTFCTFAKNTATDPVHSLVVLNDEGCMGAADSEVVRIDPKYLAINAPLDGVSYIPSVGFEKLTMEACHRYLALLKQLGQVGPWYINVSLLDLQPSLIYVSPRYGGGRRNKPFEGKNIIPDPVLIDPTVQIASQQDVARIMRPLFDFIWREFGFSGSKNYDATGQWTGQV